MGKGRIADRTGDQLEVLDDSRRLALVRHLPRVSGSGPEDEVLDRVIPHDLIAKGVGDDAAQAGGVGVRTDAVAAHPFHDFIEHEIPVSLQARRGIVVEQGEKGRDIVGADGGGYGTGKLQALVAGKAVIGEGSPFARPGGRRGAGGRMAGGRHTGRRPGCGSFRIVYKPDGGSQGEENAGGGDQGTA